MSFAQLPSRALLRISGEDMDDFLQGLITNDIKKLDNQPAIYACLLTPQGKFLYDFFIINEGDSYLIDCENETRAALLKKLKLHKLRSQVTIEEAEGLVYAFWEEDDTPEQSFVDPRLSLLGHRLITSTPLEATSAEEDFILFCHAQGVPYHSLDLIPQKSILLESNLDELQAISWDKGCYMGQELTARTKHRGLVRKRLFPVHVQGSTPNVGDPIEQDDQSVGEMRSSSDGIGIALLRLEAFENQDKPFTVNGNLIKPYAPNWMSV